VISVSRFIAAPPEKVYAAITDITRMGDWSPEVARSEWVEGFDAPAVGARYVGHNEFGDKGWSIEAEIIELVENERFTFECMSPSSGKPYAQWGYVIESADGGCNVTEWTKDNRSEESKARANAALGIADRVTRNRDGMAETLNRIAAACEGG